MRKVTAFVVVKDSKILSLSVMTAKHEKIDLIDDYYWQDRLGYKHNNFRELQDDVLALLKTNNFKPYEHKDFGCTWHSIYYMNLDKMSYTFMKYGYSKSGG